MSLTRPQIRSKCYHRVPGLGMAGTAESVSSTAIIDAFAFQDDEAADGQYEGSYIYRPNLNTNDRVKPAGRLSGSSLSHNGSAYVDENDLTYELVGLVHPDELNACIERAMRRIYFETFVPIGPWTDHDFSGGVASVWTALQVNTVCTLSATPANNFSGFNSLVCTNGAGNGYTETSVLYVTPGDRITHGAINRVLGAYTAAYRLWDETNDEEIGTALSHSQRNWQHLIRTDTIPDGCYEVRARLQGVESNAVVVWDSLFGHAVDQRHIPAPEWLSEPFQLLGFGPREYGRSIDTGRHNADTKRQVSWYRPMDFDLHPLIEEASPRTLQINREPHAQAPLPERDLWIHGKRPYSDMAAMDDEDDSTDAPEELVMSAVLAELAELLWTRYREPQWDRMWNENEARLASQKVVRKPIAPRRETYHYSPGGRVGR